MGQEKLSYNEKAEWLCTTCKIIQLSLENTALPPNFIITIIFVAYRDINKQNYN